MPSLAELQAFLAAVASNLVSLAAGIVGLAFTAYGVIKRETPRGKAALVFALVAYTLALGATWIEEHRLRITADKLAHDVGLDKARLTGQIDEKSNRIEFLEKLLASTLVKGQAKPAIALHKIEIAPPSNAEIRTATVLLIVPDKPLPTPTDVVIVCSEEIVDYRWWIIGASSVSGGGPVPVSMTSGPLQGWRGFRFQINAPNITPEHPLGVTMYSRKSVNCRVQL